jgi:hypothetical protein
MRKDNDPESDSGDKTKRSKEYAVQNDTGNSIAHLQLEPLQKNCQQPSHDRQMSNHDRTIEDLPRGQRTGTTTNSFQEEKNSCTNIHSSLDALFRSLMKSSTLTLDACSCSVSTLLMNMSHSKGNCCFDSYKDSDTNIRESVEGDLVLIENGSSIDTRDNQDYYIGNVFEMENIHEEAELSSVTMINSDHDYGNVSSFNSDDEMLGFSACQFEQIGRNLVEQAESSPGHQVEVSEDLRLVQDDLDRFIDTAIEILPHLFAQFDPQSKRVLPVPPLPPMESYEKDDPSCIEDSLPLEKMISVLPPEFICPLCQHPIVGAMSLKCAENQSYCTSCVEQYCTAMRTGCNTKTNQNEFCIFCPLCKEDCENAPCHALDVAILRFMMDFDLHLKNKLKLGLFYFRQLKKTETN